MKTKRMLDFIIGNRTHRPAIRRFAIALALFAICVGLLASCQSGAETPSSVRTDVSTEIPHDTPTPFAVPTPANPNLRHIELKRRVLGIINTHRASRSLPPFRTGSNISAQLHAEKSLEDCNFGPWDSDGLSIYMKHSLVGGYQTHELLGYGANYCSDASERIPTVGDPTDKLTVAAHSMMTGSRDSPLWSLRYRSMSIGIAHEEDDLWLYILLDADYVHYDELPKIENGELVVVGTTNGLFKFITPDQLTVQLAYDPPPEPLTAGQLARGACLTGSRLVMSLFPPENVGSYRSSDPFTVTHDRCKPPREIPADLPPPESMTEARRLITESRSSREPYTNVVPQLRAAQWSAVGNEFAVRADISNLLEQFGPGVYTVVVSHDTARSEELISQYSIFHKIIPPDIYTPIP